MGYSVAIRTLGLAPEILRRELISVFRQTLKPEKVVLYIAHGYKIPDFRIASEQYVYVKKGMVAQRALQYREIESEYILLLDDDVELSPDSVQRMMEGIEAGYDCIAADTFKNHEMNASQIIYNIFTNAALPAFSQKKAFQVRRSAAFSYIMHPRRDVYPSDSAAGPASLWRKSTLLAIHLEHELWMDELGFSYGDDLVEFNKIPKNGYQLGVHFRAGITNLDARTSSGAFRKDALRFFYRSRGQFLIWYRCCYNLPKSSFGERFLAAVAFVGKVLWQLPAHVIVAIMQCNPRILYLYFKGYVEGMRMAHREPLNSLPPYQLY